MPLIGASSIGDLLNPLFQALSGLIAFFYSLIPNYAIAIGLLTFTVMLILSPLTVKSTRSMIAMQRLAPEMKKLQQKYKGDRQRLNEEMMKFYRENNVSPMGGCLPLILQAPLLFIMYDVIRGLTNTVMVHGHVVPAPKYISHSTELYHHLVASGGKMVSFGVDLSKSATAHHSSLGAALPYWIIIVAAIGLQYFQMRQLNGRNPQMAAANPQAMMLQKYMPLVFGFIYIGIPAGVNVYFLVSSVFRIGQQELMFRYDPKLKQMSSGAIPAKAKEIDPAKKGDASSRRGSWLARALGPPGEGPPADPKAGGGRPDAGASDTEAETGDEGGGPPAGEGGGDPGRGQSGTRREPPKTTPGPRGAGRNGKPSGNGSRRRTASNGSGGNGKKQPAHPRSQSKRRRKAR